MDGNVVLGKSIWPYLDIEDMVYGMEFLCRIGMVCRFSFGAVEDLDKAATFFRPFGHEDAGDYGVEVALAGIGNFIVPPFKEGRFFALPMKAGRVEGVPYIIYQGKKSAMSSPGFSETSTDFPATPALAPQPRKAL